MHPGIPLQTGSGQFGCNDSFQQALILCPPTIQGKKLFIALSFLLRVTLSSMLISDKLLVIFPAGIPTNTAKPAGYSVRMEASVPLVTQAPPIQPLQIRPGVITQVKGLLVFIFNCRSSKKKKSFDVQKWSNSIEDDDKGNSASLHFNRPGLTVHSRSWCPLGSRWHLCPRHQQLWHLTRWRAHRDWVIGGKHFSPVWRCSSTRL